MDKSKHEKYLDDLVKMETLTRLLEKAVFRYVYNVKISDIVSTLPLIEQELVYKLLNEVDFNDV